MEHHEPPDIDERTFAAFQAGDSEAVTRVVLACQDRLVAFLMVFTGRREVAEEIAQEALVKLYGERRRLVDAGRILPWLMITGRRMALRAMSRGQHRLEYNFTNDALDEMAPPSHPDPAAELLQEEFERHLHSAMTELKPVDRELIALRFFANLQLHEIGEALSMPLGTVGVKLQRALVRLRTVLEKRGLSFGDFS